jgi:hypothetical protein
VDGLTLDQWLLFAAVTLRARYRAVARAAFPHLEAELPLVKAAKLHAVVVNGGEAVHLIFTRTASPEPTACRHLALDPPEGVSLRDWAFVNEDGYKRFVERMVPGPRLGHVLLFPEDGDEHATLVRAADQLVREHAAQLAA